MTAPKPAKLSAAFYDEARRIGAPPETVLAVGHKPAADLGPAITQLLSGVGSSFARRSLVRCRSPWRGDHVRSMIAAVRILRREQEAGT